jgi:hypothetical protein
VVSDVPLVPGPLYGLRTWRVLASGGRERLAGPHRGTVWPPGHRWLAATCDAGHPAPAPGCRCGIHAWHPRPASARRILAPRFELPGIVEGDGTVEVHEEGFRAERARPYAFVRLPGRNPSLIERLATAYGAEVLDVRRPRELLDACQARGLGLYESVVEDILGEETLTERRRARARARRADAVRILAATLIPAALAALGIAAEH